MSCSMSLQNGDTCAEVTGEDLNDATRFCADCGDPVCPKHSDVIAIEKLQIAICVTCASANVITRITKQLRDTQALIRQGNVRLGLEKVADMIAVLTDTKNLLDAFTKAESTDGQHTAAA